MNPMTPERILHYGIVMFGHGSSGCCSMVRREGLRVRRGFSSPALTPTTSPLAVAYLIETLRVRCAVARKRAQVRRRQNPRCMPHEKPATYPCKIRPKHHPRPITGHSNGTQRSPEQPICNQNEIASGDNLSTDGSRMVVGQDFAMGRPLLLSR